MCQLSLYFSTAPSPRSPSSRRGEGVPNHPTLSAIKLALPLVIHGLMFLGLPCQTRPSPSLLPPFSHLITMGQAIDSRAPFRRGIPGNANVIRGYIQPPDGESPEPRPPPSATAAASAPALCVWCLVRCCTVVWGSVAYRAATGAA